LHSQRIETHRSTAACKPISFPLYSLLHSQRIETVWGFLGWQTSQHLPLYSLLHSQRIETRICYRCVIFSVLAFIAYCIRRGLKLLSLAPILSKFRGFIAYCICRGLKLKSVLEDVPNLFALYSLLHSQRIETNVPSYIGNMSRSGLYSLLHSQRIYNSAEYWVLSTELK